jgi:hypothetical protein
MRERDTHTQRQRQSERERARVRERDRERESERERGERETRETRERGRTYKCNDSAASLRARHRRLLPFACGRRGGRTGRGPHRGQDTVDDAERDVGDRHDAVDCVERGARLEGIGRHDGHLGRPVGPTKSEQRHALPFLKKESHKYLRATCTYIYRELSL